MRNWVTTSALLDLAANLPTAFFVHLTSFVIIKSLYCLIPAAKTLINNCRVLMLCECQQSLLFRHYGNYVTQKTLYLDVQTVIHGYFLYQLGCIFLE